MKLGKHQLNALLFFYRNPGPHAYKENDRTTRKAISALIEETLLWFCYDKAGKLVSDMAEITDHGKKWVKDYLNDLLFIGTFGEGYSYANRKVEKHGDYKRLAFLSFSTLELKIEPDCPAHLRPFIEDHAATVKSRKGQQEPISASQYVTLGYGIK